MDQVSKNSKIDILLEEIRSSSEEKIMHLCLCVFGGGTNYIL